MSRVSLPASRFQALVMAASKVGCVCAAPEYREHDGMCIGCWALGKRVAHLRELLACSSSATLSRILAECEEEQSFRAREIPNAEKRLAEARKANT